MVREPAGKFPHLIDFSAPVQRHEHVQAARTRGLDEGGRLDAIEQAAAPTAAAYTLEAILAYPYPTDLSAATGHERIAWIGHEPALAGYGAFVTLA